MHEASETSWEEKSPVVKISLVLGFALFVIAGGFALGGMLHKKEASIVGMWTCDSERGVHTYNFREDGRMVILGVDGPARGQFLNGQYTREDDVLNFQFPQINKRISAQIAAIKQDQLEFLIGPRKESCVRSFSEKDVR